MDVTSWAISFPIRNASSLDLPGRCTKIESYEGEEKRVESVHGAEEEKDTTQYSPVSP